MGLCHRPPAGSASGRPAATEFILQESPAALIRPNLAQRAAVTMVMYSADGGRNATNRSAQQLAYRRIHIPVVMAWGCSQQV
jgi:hypothetical protein